MPEKMKPPGEVPLYPKNAAPAERERWRGKVNVAIEAISSDADGVDEVPRITLPDISRENSDEEITEKTPDDVVLEEDDGLEEGPIRINIRPK